MVVRASHKTLVIHCMTLHENTLEKLPLPFYVFKLLFNLLLSCGFISSSSSSLLSDVAARLPLI